MNDSRPRAQPDQPSPATQPLSLGAIDLGGGRCEFLVWAPRAKRVDVVVIEPRPCVLPMQPRDRGYFVAVGEGLEPGSVYFYRLDGEQQRPDPASRYQPRGVHGPSQIVTRSFDWHDSHWSGLPLGKYITYELHVGTFTAEGTLDAVIGHLDELAELGVTAIELMPLSQFPGGRNWGYDGVHPFAVQNTYGGPLALKRLVDACHRRGLAVVLDVVYNHLGPEGNYLAQFAPYFTSRYRTPWGEALNFDGPHGDEVRRFFIENALYWLDEFHIDALRLDAIHAIFDSSAKSFLQELADAIGAARERLERPLYLIGESNLNDARTVLPKQLGGQGLDAQWTDDLHHALHATLTGERCGYYADFADVDCLVKAYREGFVYSGQYSNYRRRSYGSSGVGLPAESFVVCAQNHDQVGNRLHGDRLGTTISFGQQKLAAAAVLLSPFQPLLFMGEEYGETAPFLYFISHGDSALIAAIRRGRPAEFAAFGWQGSPPDPQAAETFEHCKLNHALKRGHSGRVLRNFYRRLIAIRRSDPALAAPDRRRMSVTRVDDRTIAMHMRTPAHDVLTVLHFGGSPITVQVAAPTGDWSKILDSSDEEWLGTGSRVPASLASSGELKLSVAQYSAVVLTRYEDS